MPRFRQPVSENFASLTTPERLDLLNADRELVRAESTWMRASDAAQALARVNAPEADYQKACAGALRLFAILQQKTTQRRDAWLAYEKAADAWRTAKNSKRAAKSEQG